MSSRKSFFRFGALQALVVIGLFGILLATGFFGMALRPFAWVSTKISAPGYSSAVSLRSLLGYDQPVVPTVNSTQKTIEDLRVENSKLRTLVSENEALKQALSFSDRDHEKTINSRVLSFTDGDVIHGLVIDRGSLDGLVVGQAVISGDGVLVGKIFETRRSTATVMLLTDSRSRLAVTVQNGTETLGVLEGDRGLSMHIGLIPQGAVVAPGDTVVTSGLEPGIKLGLQVGTVERVQRTAQDPFQTASVVPFSAASRPIFVQVLVGGQEVEGEQPNVLRVN